MRTLARSRLAARRPLLVHAAPQAPSASRPLPRFLWWTIAAYVFLLPVQFMAGDFNAAPCDLFVFVFLLFGLARLRFPKRAWSPWHAGLLLIFILASFIAGLNSGSLSKFVYLNKTAGIFFLLLTYLVLTSVASEWSTVRPLLKVFIYAVTLHVVAGSVVLFLGPRIGFTPPWMNYYYGRLSGMLIDPNAFGGLVVTALAIHATTYFGERPIIRGPLGLACVVTLAAGLLLTLSRSAWIGFGMALLFATPFRPRLAAAYAVVGLVAAAVLAVMLSQGNLDRTVRLADRPGTAQQRLEQFEQALPMVREHPLLGIGLGGFLDLHGWIIHDTTLWMLTEFGLIGLACFLGFTGWFVFHGIRVYQVTVGPDRDLLLGLMCAHVGMFGVSVGIEAFYQRHWWLVMSLIAAAPMGVRLVRRRPAQTAEVGR